MVLTEVEERLDRDAFPAVEFVAAACDVYEASDMVEA